MSSFLGHAATGAALYLCQARLAAPQTRWALPLCVLLAVLPDFDYFPLWLWGIDMAPRLTHSLLFALLAGGTAWATLCWCYRGARVPVAPLVLFAAAGSHLLLDLLVGVHSVPVFWPLPDGSITSPIGLLPSAGRLAIGNVYLWRNLLIESGVLFPALAAMVAICRQVAWRAALPKVLVLGPLWLGFLVWSLRVHA